MAFPERSWNLGAVLLPTQAAEGRGWLELPRCLLVTSVVSQCPKERSLWGSFPLYWALVKHIKENPKCTAKYLKITFLCLPLAIYVTNLWPSPPNFFLPPLPCIPPNSLKPNYRSTYLFTPGSLPLSGLIPPVAGSSLSPFYSKSISPLLAHYSNQHHSIFIRVAEVL